MIDWVIGGLSLCEIGQLACMLIAIFFRHNDRNIPEHYIDNCIRPNEKENVYHQLGKNYREIGYRIKKMSNRIFSHKLTKEDWSKFTQDFDWFEENIAVPMYAIAAIDMGLVKVSIDFHRKLEKCSDKT